MAGGRKADGQRDVPAPVADLSYAQDAAGVGHAAPLRSEGSAVAFGRYVESRCDIPTLVTDPSYTRVAAGAGYTALLRSGGVPWPAAGALRVSTTSLRWSPT